MSGARRSAGLAGDMLADAPAEAGAGMLVEAIVEDDAWTAAIGPAQGFVDRVAAAARARAPALGGPAAALFADDAALRDLNRRFRATDRPTNVLAFPSGASAPDFLGDVAIARETALAEAAARGVPPAEHAAHLLVHGLLHLVGYDHQDDEDARAMETLETRILADLGLADPYADAPGVAGGAAAEAAR